MKDNKINPYSWDHISGDKYWEIYDILYNDTFTDIDKQARLCSAIEDIDLDTFYSLPVIEAKKKIAQLNFLNDFKLKKHYHPNYIKIGDYRCKVIQASDMSVAQFIDYQNFITIPFRDNYYKILSIFLVPDGHNYNEGYDISEIQNLIRQMTWVDIQSLLNFILVEYIKSLYSSLLYLTRKVKKMKGQEKEMMMLKIEELNRTIEGLMDFHI